jgi:hypothetical protein
MFRVVIQQIFDRPTELQAPLVLEVALTDPSGKFYILIFRWLPLKAFREAQRPFHRLPVESLLA